MVAGTCWALVAASVTAAEIDIEKAAGGRAPIPIALSGYAGEVDAVLRFDLYVAGFKLAAADQAQYDLRGSSDGSVKGQLVDRISQSTLFARAYSSRTLRAQAHKLSDDVVLAVTGKAGVAQTKIAYKRDTGGNSEVWIGDYDGFGARAVTRDGIARTPAWVPGRWRLYYTSYLKGTPDIYSLDLASGTRKAVAAYGGLNTSPAVSADGTRVAMILSRAGSPDLYVANADGSNLKQLTKTKEAESSPCWSPDGRTICFVSRARGRPDLYLIEASGGEMRRLSTGGIATEPDWSPDGRLIAFTTQRGGIDFRICMIPAGGGTVEELAPGEDPSWAPNSRTLIYSRRAGGKRLLSLLDVPTKQYKDLTLISGSCSEPSWAK